MCGCERSEEDFDRQFEVELSSGVLAVSALRRNVPVDVAAFVFPGCVLIAFEDPTTRTRTELGRGAYDVKFPCMLIFKQPILTASVSTHTCMQ